MATHTLGSTTEVTTGNNITAAYNEIINTFGFVMPANGYVTLLAGVFGDSGGGTIFGQLLLFDGSYNLLAGGTAGGQNFSGIGWQTQTVGPYFIASGATVHLGWFVSPGSSQKFYTYGSGGWKGGSVSVPASAGGFSQPGSPYFQSYPNSYLQWIDPVVVSGVSPSTAAAGAGVTITGSGFTGGSVTGVTFNGVGASFIVVDDTHITATVPGGFTSGTLTVTSDHGNGSTAFTEASPTISGVSPNPDGVGQVVTVTGSGFANGSITSITFNGAAASSYTVVSDTSLTVTIPSGATTGPLVVNTNHGSASISFTVSSARAYDGSAFQSSQVYAYDGSAFQTGQVFVFDGASWQSSD